MTDKHSTYESTLSEREQTILDTALLESDQLLARSLHDDQRRRRRRFWLLASVFGGVVMFGFLLAFVFGMFTFTVPEVAEAKGKRPTQEAIEQAEALAAQGWQLWKKQDLLAAAEKFEESVELNPKAANAWNGYGWALFNSGQSTRALRAFEQCVKRSPKHPAGLNGLGQLYLSRGEYKQAEKYLKKSAKNPQASAAWYGLTRVYLLAGEYKKALPWAKKAAAAGSSDDFAKQMLAAAKSGKLSDELRQVLEPIATWQGKEDLKSATEDVPKLNWAYGIKANEKAVAVTTPPEKDDFQRAWKMFFQQKYTTSERLFRRVLETDPKNPHAINGLGWSLLNQGKHAKAKVLLQQSLAIEPEHWGAMAGLASCLNKEGNVDGAVKLWERVATKSEGANDATIMLAEIYLKRKQYEKAAACYEKIVKWFPDRKIFRNLLSEAKAGLVEDTN